MRINSIEIQNFRGFRQQVFHFPEQFTIFIGDNGKGKTTSIEALTVAIGAYLLGITEATKRHIETEEIHRIDFGDYFAPQIPVCIIAKGQIDGLEIEWQRAKLSSRTTTKDANAISQIAIKHEEAVNTRGERIDLPILAKYGTNRLFVEKSQRIGTKQKTSKLREGYYACLESKSDSSWLEWFHTYEYSLKTRGKDETLLNAIKEAISQCIENWTDIYFDFEDNDLIGTRLLEGKKIRMPFRHLSDGQRNIVGMVAELAYRCITLNGHLGANAVKGSKGVVLIDEIDQHLHPNWQRHIVHDLKTAFPNLQFIATTHSPFIVQSLSANELINLDSLTDSNPSDLSIEEVSTHIMGVENTFGIVSENQENISKTYFEVLDNKSPSSPTIVEQELDDMESKIIDPSVRAFLQMKRLKKQVTQTI